MTHTNKKPLTTFSLAMMNIVIVGSLQVLTKHPAITRSFNKIPGNYLGVWIIAILGSLSALVALGVGFIPPSQTYIVTTATYDFILASGIIIACIIPLIIFKLSDALNLDHQPH